jgi:hypothetical protein
MFTSCMFGSTLPGMQKVITRYTDDLTGEESDEIRTHTILIDGAGVELDLAPDSHDKLLEALRPFLDSNGARRIRGLVTSKSGGRAKHRAASPTGGGHDSSAIRSWARENGYSVSARGRVSAEVRDAFQRANSH